MVAVSQTPMDGAPRDRIDRMLRHEGHVTENVVIGMEIRHPWSHDVMRLRLIIRAYQSDGEVTAALGAWNEDDGA